MDIFSENKWLKRGIVALMVLNLTIIGLVVLKKPKRQTGPRLPMYNVAEMQANFERTTRFLTNELSLTPAQVQEMIKIHDSFHVNQRREIFAQHEKRDSISLTLFSTTREKMDTVLFFKLANSLSIHAYEIETMRLRQAQAFRQMLSPEQDAKLISLINEVQEYFRPKFVNKKPQ